MFISGCGSKYNSKKIIAYLFISILFIMSASISIMSKSALAEDIGKKIENGTASCKDASKGAGGKSWRETRTLHGNQGWWWCESSSGERFRLDEILCAAGYDIEDKTEDYRSHSYRKTRCIKKTENSNKTSTIDKRAIALANTAGQSKLEGVILPKITDTPWFKTLSDKDKLDSGCVDSGGGKITCDEHAKITLTKGLVGTCIASARTTVANRPDGQDKSNEQIDKAFTDCITGNSGLDKDTVNNNKTPIAWNDIDSYIKEEDKKEAEATEKSKADEAKNSCGIGGMGWLICPLMTFMGEIADASYSVISQFLNINPAIFGEGSDAVGAKQAWNFFRDIANVIFVLLFLWVIFSQVSSIGISNYGIKKILPKLIVGAVLVNLSFYICQLAVDLSNILGFTLKEALEGAVSGVGGSSSNSAIASGLGAAVAGILVLTGTVLFAALAVSIPTLLSLMLVLLVVLVILIVRQAAIVLLISIAPLAFAAWLLPNTESLFKKWVSMFRGLLMVFPIISLLYGAGKLAGAILMTTATSDPNDTAITMQFAGLAASILPLGATPFVLQSSLNSLGNIGAKIGRMGANAHSRFAGNIKGAAKGRVDNSVIGDTKRKYSDFMNRKRASRRTGKFATWRDNSPLGQFMGWDKGGARARATVAKAFESDVENASTMLQGMTSDKIANIANGTTVESKAMRAAAIDHTMANGSFKERMDVLSSLKGTDNSIKQRAIKAAYAKKDNNIIGNGLGDAILNDEVGSTQDLSNMAVNNAASGNLQAEHLVQNGAATKWLSDAITTSGSQQAKDAFIKAGEVAISNPNTAKNINQAISEALNAHGVVAHNTPQNTSSYNSQQNSQGSSPQQSPQNNQQNNSNSGEKIIIATSQEDVRKALEDSRRRGN